MAEKAGFLWLHGLGDSGSGWFSLGRAVQQKFPFVETRFPDAPRLPVTCNQGMKMPSWFDIDDIPVAASENDCPKYLDDSVKLVHEQLDLLVGAGIPANRIVVGGFSQGSALAQLAGMTYGSPLGGIVGFSGWGMKRAQIGSLISEANKKTPMFLGHGEADSTVLYALGKESGENLIRQGKENVTMKSYPGLAHSSSQQEERDLMAWLSNVYSSK